MLKVAKLIHRGTLKATEERERVAQIHQEN